MDRPSRVERFENDVFFKKTLFSSVDGEKTVTSSKKTRPGARPLDREYPGKMADRRYHAH